MFSFVRCCLFQIDSLHQHDLDIKVTPFGTIEEESCCAKSVVVYLQNSRTPARATNTRKHVSTCTRARVHVQTYTRKPDTHTHVHLHTQACARAHVHLRRAPSHTYASWNDLWAKGGSLCPFVFLLVYFGCSFGSCFTFGVFYATLQF